VLWVETIGNLRHRRLVQGESISGIARGRGISRNTVKKALRSAGEPFVYQRQPRLKLGAYLATLESWLEAEEKFPVRERRTAQCIFEGLRLEGYAGSVDQVRRYIRPGQCQSAGQASQPAGCEAMGAVSQVRVSPTMARGALDHGARRPS
jgi:transposase